MADRFQRKINKQIKLFNKGFEKDISPYCMYRVRQVERYNPKNVWESAWRLQLTKGGEVISERWLSFYEIINPRGENYAGRELFWWLNNEVVRTKND
jgi:hypothetical protein